MDAFAFVALELNLPGPCHPFPDRGGRLSGFISGNFFPLEGGDFNVKIDSVQ